MQKAPYDPVADFAAIARVGEAPMLVVMNPRRPQTNIADVVADMKAHPEKWEFGVAALGAMGHLATIGFGHLGGVKPTIVPYRGTAPALNDVAFPAYARMQADKGAVAWSFSRALGLIMLVALPCYVGLAATAEPLVLTAMGPRWAEVVPLVRLLAFAMPFVTLHILYPPATNALGKPRIGAISSGEGALLLPAAFAVGVYYGPLGMAAAWVMATPLLVLVSSSLSLPVIGLSWRRLGGGREALAADRRA